MEGKSTAIRVSRIFALLLLALPAVGCFGIPAQIMYVLKGHNVPAAFDGMQEKRVAVVCRSDVSAYGPNDLTYAIERAVGANLARKVKKITVVPQSEISNWRDNNGWEQVDHLKLGKEMNADLVLVIEVSSYSLYDGSTMYKGRSNLTSTVYDLNNGGQVIFAKGPEDYVFPTQGVPALQTSERNFESMFLAKLTQFLSRRFYPHEKLDDFADDATSIH